MTDPKSPPLREWTLLFKGDGYFEPRVLGAEPSDFPKGGKITVEVIEVKALTSLQARYDELLVSIPKVPTHPYEQSLLDQIAEAKAELERERAETAKMKEWFTLREILSFRGWEMPETGDMYLIVSKRDLLASPDGKAEQAAINLREELTAARQEVAHLNEALAHQGVDFGAEIEKLREEVARLKDKTAVVRLDIDNRIAMANVERDDAVEQMNTWYKANKSLCDVIKERDEARADVERLGEELQGNICNVCWSSMESGQETTQQRPPNNPRALLTKATAALENLITKMDIVHEDKRYVGVFALAQQRYGRYDGPQYEKEFDAAKETLRKMKGEV